VHFTSQQIETYCKQFSLNDSHLLKRLTKKTWESEEIPKMLSGSLVGGILQMLIKVSGAKNILEIGMFTGYSALKMAEVLPQNGRIDSCELMQKHIATASQWFNESESGHKITIHEGQAMKSLEKFKNNSFDMVFVDADKINYPNYHNKGLQLLKSGGIGVFDNMLWSGSVLEPYDDDSKALRETAELIKNNDRLEPLLLPVRDGVMIYRKIK